MNIKKYFLQLAELEGVGHAAVKKIIDHYGNISNVFNATHEEISKISGLSKDAAKKIVDLENEINPEIDHKLDELKKKGCGLYFYGEDDYPQLLAEIHDPPSVIYSEGTIEKADYNAVAVVGTRKATEYGKRAARLISKKLAASNITVISGCALGIDTAAHEGAIEGGGRTIAVLGSGLNKKYPSQNIGLMRKISENGAVISEFPLNAEPFPYNFPLRNRIISGLSLGVVVVEAPVRSGALITAFQALEQGREVFAVPGSIFSS
ncbi:DNA-processing protein DprA, partial [Elusimicrobiota bacterium]